jgi:hypothetical protein
MKLRLLLVTVTCSAISLLASAQSDYSEKPLVRKSAYHDQTAPLRDMPVILPGERHRSWKDNIIGNKSMEDSIRNQRADIPGGFVDPVLQQNYPATRSNRGPILNMDGVGNLASVYPPDTDGDVGLNYYFQMINLSFAIWDKQGNLLYGPVDNSTLWNGFIGPWTGTNDGDPIVLYDELADRWIASQFAINTPDGSYWQLVAVSATSDPLGSYYRYAFQMPAFNDYPKMAVWPDAYYATFNMFGSYTRVGVAAFERDAMLAGLDADMVYYDQPNGTFSMLPSDFDGTPPPAGTPCYFTHLRTFSSQNLEVYEFNVDWTNPSNSSFTLVNTLSPASFNPNIDGIPQPNTGTQLDALNFMLMYRLQYRNFGTYQTLVTNHTVNASGRAGVRWYELRKESAGWYIYQQGTYSPDNKHRWMASVAMSGNGKLAIGFSMSSSSVFPSVCYVGRSPEAPLGEMNFPEIMIMPGTSSQSGIDRWGDYSALSIDPGTDTTFWFTTEYMRGPWRTRIASFDFGPILPPYVFAGSDTTVCESEPFMANATANYTQSLQWTTGGDGFFVDPTKTDAIYLRGTGDLAAGHVTLFMNGTGFTQGSQASDTVDLAFSKLAKANAGVDTTICIGEVIQLSGTAQYQDSILWTTEGDGTFDDPRIFDPIYTPGPTDISKKYAWLRLTAYDSLPCETFKMDKMKLTLDDCTNVGENGPQGQQFTVVPNPTSGRITVSLAGFEGQKKLALTLSDAQGQVLFTMSLNDRGGNYQNDLDLSYYPKGIYYLKVTSDTGQMVRKVIKN